MKVKNTQDGDWDVCEIRDEFRYWTIDWGHRRRVWQKDNIMILKKTQLSWDWIFRMSWIVMIVRYESLGMNDKWSDNDIENSNFVCELNTLYFIQK
jgi:hypothetical protein